MIPDKVLQKPGVRKVDLEDDFWCTHVAAISRTSMFSSSRHLQMTSSISRTFASEIKTS